MRTITRLSILAAALTLLGTACSASDDAGATSFGGDAATTATTVVATGAAQEDYALSDSDAPEVLAPADREAVDGAATNAQQVTTSVVDLARSIIFTANLTIEVDDVIAAGAEVANAVAGLGGILFGQETTTGEYPRSVLTIKLPPERFDDALERLGGIGTLMSQSVFADDVTERVVDLESRIRTAEVSVDRLRSLLEAANDINDVVALESELVDRETELEVLRGQLRTLENAVSLATIVVVLTEPVPDEPQPSVEMVQTAYLGHDGGSGCPGTEELTLDEGDQMTVCFEITNTGDTDLGEIVVRDYGLDMDEKDLITVVGDLSVPLRPDERIILAFETVADPDEYTAPGIDVTPLDDDGEPLRIQVEVEIQDAFLRIVRDTSLPGFSDGLAAAWGALQRFLGVIVLGAGAAIPFLWVPLVALGVWWWRRRTTTPNGPSD